MVPPGRASPRRSSRRSCAPRRFDRGDRVVIVCLRTVGVPTDAWDRYLVCIAAGRRVRQEHGILAELVLELSRGTAETVVITIWPDHETFDAWIATVEGRPYGLGRPPDRRIPPDHPLGRGRRLSQSSRPRHPARCLPDPGGPPVKWITRARPKTDRIACPWL